MKRLKKVSLLLMAAMLLMLSAFAANASVARWSYLSKLEAYMEVNNVGLANISVNCYSDATEVNKVMLKCELQQFDGTWKTIKTWKETENDSFIIYDKSYSIAKNYSYRLKLTAYAYKDSKLLETVTENFDQGYYK